MAFFSFSAAFCLIALAAAEVAVRRAGLANVPLFRRDRQLGYAMAPGQRGAFRGRHAWIYNGQGMRVADDPVTLAGATLVIGDSVVDGGIRVHQADTLAETLRAQTTSPVWPVACHGWGLVNELAALRALPDWTQAARIVFVLNPDDFGPIDMRGGELSFPTRRPLCRTAWLLCRQFYRSPLGARLFGLVKADAGDADFHDRLVQDFAETLSGYGGAVSIVRYPKRGQGDRGEQLYDRLVTAAGSERCRLIELASRPGWSDGCYLDSIHPNREGIRVLAAAIAHEAF